MKTSTRNAIITGFFSLIAGAVGGFFSGQSVGQSVSQSIILNIDGETFSIDSDDYQKLYDEKASLSKQLDELQSTKMNLEKDIDELQSENMNLDVKNQSLNTENQTLKTQKESLEAENQSLRGENESLKDDIKNIPANTETTNNNIGGQSVYLMDVCPPYDSSGSNYDTTQFKMEGETRMNGFFIKGSGGYILINLNEKYSNLEFDLGHVDGANKFSWTLNIYLDGKLTATIEKKPDDMVTHENIQLNYAKQLKFEYISGSSGHYTEYGLGEIKLQY